MRKRIQYFVLFNTHIFYTGLNIQCDFQSFHSIQFGVPLITIGFVEDLVTLSRHLSAFFKLFWQQFLIKDIRNHQTTDWTDHKKIFQGVFIFGVLATLFRDKPTQVKFDDIFTTKLSNLEHMISRNTMERLLENLSNH